MNGPKEIVRSFALFLRPHFKYLAFDPVSPHMAYLQLGVKIKKKKIVLKLLKFPRREQMVVLNSHGKKLMGMKTMARKLGALRVSVNLGEVRRWTYSTLDRVSPAINPQAVATDSVTLSDIHSNWQRECDKQAYF